jgi:alkylation response protein AidB-like acyl-CoA dehydrogenase
LARLPQQDECCGGSGFLGWQSHYLTHAHNGALPTNALQWAVVFAQLLIGGTNHGIHGFLVPIRNKQVGVQPNNHQRLQRRQMARTSAILWLWVRRKRQASGQPATPHAPPPPFLSPLQDMSPCRGVRIEDMGHKMGCNGVDNGKLWFDRECCCPNDCCCLADAAAAAVIAAAGSA